MLAVVRRRAALVILTCLAVSALAYVIAGSRPITYSADSTLNVPSGGGGGGPGQANEAISLANTYAELIPRDDGVLVAVASGVRQPVAQVDRSLSVSPIGTTSLLRVRYVDADRSTALLGSRTATQAVIDGIVTGGSVPRGSVELVSLATDRDVTASGGRTGSTVPIAVVLGLALGGVLALAAERANRRIDGATDIATVLDAPAFDLDAATAAQRMALVRRWQAAAGGDRPVLVAVVGVAVPHASVVRVCDRVAAGLSADDVVVARDAQLPAADARGQIGLFAAGAPGTGEPNEDLVASADVLVLLVPRAVRRALLVRTATDLTTYTRRLPDFVLYTGKVRPGRGRRPSSGGSVRGSASWTDRSVESSPSDSGSSADPAPGTPPAPPTDPPAAGEVSSRRRTSLPAPTGSTVLPQD